MSRRFKQLYGEPDGKDSRNCLRVFVDRAPRVAETAARDAVDSVGMTDADHARRGVALH